MTQITEELVAETPDAAIDWVDNRVSVALGERTIPAEAVTALKEAIRGPMAERSLPGGELQKLARVLLFAVENAK